MASPETLVDLAAALERRPYPLRRPADEHLLMNLSRGFSVEEIAEFRDISVEAVELHISTVVERLGVANSHQAVLVALLVGWLRPGEIPVKPEPALITERP